MALHSMSGSLGVADSPLVLRKLCCSFVTTHSVNDNAMSITFTCLVNITHLVNDKILLIAVTIK